MYGIYGDAANVSSHIAWPSVSELEDKKNLENFIYPQSASKTIMIAKEKIKSQNAAIMERFVKILFVFLSVF